MAHANIIRPVKLTMNLPEDVRARLDLFLLSEVEGRVPKGAYQAFFVERIKEFFDNKRLQLPNGEWVSGSEDALSYLRGLYEAKSMRRV